MEPKYNKPSPKFHLSKYHTSNIIQYFPSRDALRLRLISTTWNKAVPVAFNSLVVDLTKEIRDLNRRLETDFTDQAIKLHCDICEEQRYTNKTLKSRFKMALLSPTFLDIMSESEMLVHNPQLVKYFCEVMALVGVVPEEVT